MKKCCTKLISSLLIILLAFATVPIYASAETYGDFQFIVIKNNEIEIQKYNGSNSVVEIPSTINQKNVVSIGSHAFENNEGLTKVVLPDTIEKIGQYSFYKCINLNQVVLPNSLQHIEANAFRQCSSLTEIVLPQSVTHIGGRAFVDCENLSDITFSDNITHVGYRAFYSTSWYNAQQDGPIYIGKVFYLFKGNMQEDYNLIIKLGTESITEQALFGKANLKSVELPTTLKQINNSAFAYCNNLTLVKLNKGLLTLGKSVFYSCQSLDSIYIPSTVELIDDYSFDLCGEGLIINSTEGSYAQQYANDNLFGFNVIIETEDPEDPEDILYGDINDDKNLNSKDVLLLKQYNANWDVEINKEAADVNDDKEVNSKDTLLLKQYHANWDVKLGPN